MTRLKNKYVIGCLIQAYEIEMLQEYITSCIGLLDGVENPENITFDFAFSIQEHYEKYTDDFLRYSMDKFARELSSIPQGKNQANVLIRNIYTSDIFYNIPDYRRELNDTFCTKVDFVLWGETDSMWPKQTLHLIEMITEQEFYSPKCIMSFATRVNWDSSWDKIRHPLWKGVKFLEDESFTLGDEASEKSYMSYERMNEINNVDNIDLVTFLEPKADGSCLIISSELIKSGANIPRSLILCGEDESFLRMAKLIMGGRFIQYHFSNILRVHNRRHPKKRTGIIGEQNPHGFCDSRKGDWWEILEKKSKFNLDNLQRQVNFAVRE
jgi:hypothetical protein